MSVSRCGVSGMTYCVVLCDFSQFYLVHRLSFVWQLISKVGSLFTVSLKKGDQEIQKRHMLRLLGQSIKYSLERWGLR